MNPSEIKEIILQINGTQAEEEIKRLKGIIEGTRQAKERFEQNNPDSTKWTKAQRQEWEDFNKVIAQAEQKIRKYGLTADAVIINASGTQTQAWEWRARGVFICFERFIC